ncbi:UNVERIFIED_CONTAM: Protein atp1b4 [Gekko kuhli]
MGGAAAKETDATPAGAEDYHGTHEPRLENRDEVIVQQQAEGETRECMGRTAHGWWQLFLFYLVFYLFLAGMFVLCMYVTLFTLSPYTPRHRDRVAPPGVMIRPYIGHGFTISFHMSEPRTWQRYVKNLEQFLGAYNDSVQESRNAACTPGNYFIQDTGESTMKRACQFRRSALQECSGLNDKTFGYAGGRPCILLKMNRIIGYRPGYGTPVTVGCEVLKGSESNIEATDFYPSATFDPMYFPYYGKLTHENYTSPVVAMRFTLRKNQTIPIECRLNGVGIINNMHKDRFLGRIQFIVTVNE